jgi:hypothetical protein
MSFRRVLIGLVICCLGAWLGLLWLEHHYAQKPYSLIEERLYVGSMVPVPPPGTTAVVNLSDREDRYRVDECLWTPIDGCDSPSVEWLRRVVQFIDEQRRAGRTTYIHCLAGMNRSGMVVTAYLMYEHGWGRDQALAFLQSKRPQVQPNPTMMRVLADWERALKEQPTRGNP